MKPKTVILIDPRGVHHEVSNIQEFVRDHWELFDDDEDIKHRKCPEHIAVRKSDYYTRADRGLRKVTEGAKMQWKGWRLKTS